MASSINSAPMSLSEIRARIEKLNREYPHQGTPEEKWKADRELEEAYKAFVRAGGTLLI